MPETTTPEPLIDPDCAAGKHGSCVGGPCECMCHGPAPKPAEGLRERLERAEIASEVVRAPDGNVSVITHSNRTAADRAIAVLAQMLDPGDLPARMAEALANTVCGHTILGAACFPCRAEAAMSVRWEDHAATIAQLAQALARADHAEKAAALTTERLAEARRVITALPDPAAADELREKITDLFGSPDETIVDAFLTYAWSETARIAARQMVASWQAEEEIKQLRAERDRLVDEVKTLQQDLEEFGEAQKAWLRFRRERDALKAAIEQWDRAPHSSQAHEDAQPQEARNPADSPSGELPGPLPPATAGDTAQRNPGDAEEAR